MSGFFHATIHYNKSALAGNVGFCLPRSVVDKLDLFLYSLSLMVARVKARKTIKIADLLQQLKLPEARLHHILREVNIRMAEGQKNLDQQEVARIRQYLNEQQRRTQLKKQTIALPPIIKVQQLAIALEIPVGEVLSQLLKNGVTATLNDDIDYDTAAIIAVDLGYTTEEEVEKLEEDVLTPEKLDEILKKEDVKEQQERPPVVTIMGHIDHGKTTLLDAIRSANVAAGEAGGITQAISSYQVDHKGRTITFIDTPGHETFEFMRRRGVSLADIAVLVVAADDGVKPQTKEAVKYAQEAKVPIVVAINKVDKSTANIDRVKKELAELDLLAEEWGGKTVMVAVSALKKTGIEELLELVLLAADIDPPRAIFNRNALGSVVESRIDKSLGPLATVLVHTGTLEVGDEVVIGTSAGRVRRLLDWRNKQVSHATPSMPITIVGLKSVPSAGEVLQVVEQQEEARSKALRGRAPVKKARLAGDDDKRSTLALILKADSQGSLEALTQTIEAMMPKSVRLSIIRSEVGTVSDSDVLTAAAAEALIYAFNTTISGMSRKLAEKEHVPIKQFDVIYHLSEDVRQEIIKRLPATVVREDLGKLKVLKVFFSTPRRKIVGGEVAEGSIETNALVVIKRDKQPVGSGKIIEMQRERQGIDRAQQGDQVGMTIEGKGKIKEGDVLEVYRENEVREELSGGAKKK
jgi:translation initiation factor IF-2